MRRIVVLEEAAEDIERGRKFYDLQEIGVGDYFEDTIVSDIESLGLFHGIHSKHFGFHRLLLESTTAKRPLPPRFLRFWISAKIRFGFTRN